LIGSVTAVSPCAKVRQRMRRMRRVYRWAVEGAAALMRLSPKICPVNDVVIAKRAPRGFISRVCDTMEREHWHTYQVMTKRSLSMREFLKERYGGGCGLNHIWFGLSVEDSSKIGRIRHLQESPAGVRFLSIEPLIGLMGRLKSHRHRLGDCRRGKRTAGSPDESRLGARNSRSMPRSRRRVLFQAVGRIEAKIGES
jgi:hypothetical protein